MADLNGTLHKIARSQYGEVIRETAEERHDRRVAAIAAVLRDRFVGTRVDLMAVAEEILDAAEAGF